MLRPLHHSCLMATSGPKSSSWFTKSKSSAPVPAPTPVPSPMSSRCLPPPWPDTSTSMLPLLTGRLCRSRWCRSRCTSAISSSTRFTCGVKSGDVAPAPMLSVCRPTRPAAILVTFSRRGAAAWNDPSCSPPPYIGLACGVSSVRGLLLFGHLLIDGPGPLPPISNTGFRQGGLPTLERPPPRLALLRGATPLLLRPSTSLLVPMPPPSSP
mmetsp:Transcript_28938/g.72400  ORF Transcript_28938/g.72400 Transcript_28938/m.72400 type:complete len:211 (+) Transcript_28938:645-1277(+)